MTRVITPASIIRPPAGQTATTPGEVGKAAKRGDMPPGELRRLDEACTEFESLFVNLLMKQMRKTVVKSGLVDGGMGEEIFTGILDEEISRQASFRQGLGLKDALMEQLTGKSNAAPSRNLPLTAHGTKGKRGESVFFSAIPVRGTISSPYGMRQDPITGDREFHRGIDIASPAGSAVFAAGPGRVVFSGWKKGYGNVVELRHPNGFSTLYAHNAKNLVTAGEKVATDQPIALVGSTGKSTGPHLHYEVRKNGEAIDPARVTSMSERRWYAKRI